MNCIGCLLALAVVLSLFSCAEGLSSQTFSPANITLREDGELKELIEKPLTYVDVSGVAWLAPVGTLTDGATVPRLALPVTNGRWDRAFLKAAVVHDAYCQEDNKNRTPAQYRTKSWQDTHRMFHEAMLAGGTKPLLAKIMFAAVWLGGPRWKTPEVELQPLPEEVINRMYAGSKQWIESEQPSIDDIQNLLSTNEGVVLELHNLEVKAAKALKRGKTRQAEDLLERQNQALNGVEAVNPDELTYQLYRGYWHQARSDLLIKQSKNTEASKALNSASSSFGKVLKAYPENPTALNGLARTKLAQGNFKLSRDLLEKALNVSPNYKPAASSLEAVKKTQALRVEELQRAAETRN